MDATVLSPATPLSPSAACAPAPFALEYVRLTKQEHIQLKSDALYWKTQHQRASARVKSLEAHHRQVLSKLRLQIAQTASKHKAELDFANGKIRDLRKRLFGSKSERSPGCEKRSTNTVPPRRGQRAGARSHGRTLQEHLPARHEEVALEDSNCPSCGLAFKNFAGTEDSQILEIEVKAYRRVIHRRRYLPACRCGCVPGIVTAPAPARLISRGKFGLSVWASVLLDKFKYGRPSHRLLQDLADHGLTMAPGTLAGGLQALAPLFKPLNIALQAKLRSEPHWHADETRWAVFVDIEGKVGHRWYMWVFHSKSVVHYVVDRTRSAQVIVNELAGVKQGIISCDRYSGYKRFARLTPGIVLAFCWVHQRRDFLELANSYPAYAPWALQWVDQIGHLYHLNGLRVKLALASPARAVAHANLTHALQRMQLACATGLAAPELCLPARKILRSMTVHWPGLTVFVDAPWVGMDNNQAERDMRAPVLGRKNFWGSGSEPSAELAATMYSLFGTLKLWGLNARSWLVDYLQACADNGNRPPERVESFLPWQMDVARLTLLRSHEAAQDPSRT